MVIPKFQYITYTPLWKHQKDDDEYLSITLPVALFGMLTMFTFVLLSFFSWFNIEITEKVNKEPAMLNKILASQLILLPISVISSFVILFLFSVFSETFAEFSFFREYREQVAILAETLEVEEYGKEIDVRGAANTGLRFELAIVFLFGLFAGIYYLLIYFVVYLLLYIFFIFFLINFVTFASSVTLSMLISWFALSIYIVSKKLKVEEIKKRDLDPHADYGITDRNVEILASNLPPIICSGCRSYISALSTVCNVCGDKIDNSEQL